MASLSIAITSLVFETDRDALASPDDRLQILKTQFYAEFPPADEVVVMVQGGSQQQREASVELLTELLRQHPESFSAIFPFVELTKLNRQVLMFLSEEELEQLVGAVGQARHVLESLNSPNGFASLLDGKGEQLDPGSQERFASMLPFLVELLRGIESAVSSRGRAHYQSPWGKILFAGADSRFASGVSGAVGNHRVFHTIDEGRVHLLLLRLVNKENKTIQLLRELTETTGRAHPSLVLGMTGSALLEHDEMETSERDSRRSAMLSLFLVSVVFAIAFRQLLRPLAAVFCLLLSVGWTVGFTALTIGRLNLLTVSFATILIGLGIDFGIHLLFRYEEEFSKCGDVDEALDRALIGAGPDITVGALSTAVAFWAVGLTNFTGISELGTIAGVGVTICLFSTLLILPALIAKMDRARRLSVRDAIPAGWRILLARLESQLIGRARWTLVGVGAFLLMTLPIVSTVGFDYNLLHLQDPSLESVKTELDLIERGGNTVLVSISVADSVKHANDLRQRFEALPSVSRAESVSELFPISSHRKTELLKELHCNLEGLPVEAVSTNQEKLTNGSDLEELGQGFIALEALFKTQKGTLASHRSSSVRRAATEFEVLLKKLFEEMSDVGPGPLEDGLLTFQENFLADVAAIVGFLRGQSDGPLSLAQLPENLRVRSIGLTGKLAVYIYPRENIWERPALERFVNDVRSVDPEVLGDPVTIMHYTQALKTAFEWSGLYALLAVVAMLLVYFRSITWTMLALLPLATGIYFMLFAMACYGVSFNPANFMGLPLLLGIGLDFGIHILHRSKEEGKVTMFGHSTGPATAVSAITTILGFGTLALGGHNGVASLGFVLAAGVTGIMVSALFILPALLSVWSPFPDPASLKQNAWGTD